MTKKFLIAGLSVFALAGSLVVAAPIVARADGQVEVESSNVIFCDLRADGVTYRRIGKTAKFDNRTVYFVPDLAVARDGSSCVPSFVTSATFPNPPAANNHTVKFVVDLTSDTDPAVGGDEQYDINNIRVTNTDPRFDATTVCVAPGQTATFTLSDANEDNVTILNDDELQNKDQFTLEYNSSPAKTRRVEFKPESNFVGTATASVEVTDTIIEAGESMAAVTFGGAGAAGSTSDTDFNIENGRTESFEVLLTAVFSNSCSSMSSSMSSSSMMSSSSSSMMSSSSSSSMSSSSAKSMVVDYNNAVGKGGTPRTGANN